MTAARTLVLWSAIGGAWLVALLDCVFLVWSAPQIQGAEWDAVLAAATYNTTLGASLGIVALVLFAGHRRLAAMKARALRHLARLCHPVAVLSALWIVVAFDLTSGDGISASTWRIPVLIALVAFGIGGLAAGSALYRWALGKDARVIRISLIGILLLGAIAAHRSGFYYPNSYYSAHAYMLLISVIAMALALFSLFGHRRVGRPPVHALVIAGLTALALVGALAMPLQGASRALTYRHVQTVRHVIYQSSLLLGGQQTRAIVYDPSADSEFSRYRLPPCSGRAKSPYDVILISVDSLRADRLGVANPKNNTLPNVDRLGERGLVYPNAYAPSPATATSLLPLLSGNSALTLRESGGIPTTLASELIRLGYRTISFSSFRMVTQRAFPGLSPRKLGFSKYIKIKTAAELSDSVIEILAQKSDKPFFVYAHLMEPHALYRRRKGFDFGSEITERYDSEVAFTDHYIGRIIDEIERLGRTDRTVIAVTADHGEGFREHGLLGHAWSVYEEIIRVPLVIAGPGIEPQLVTDRVSILDTAPTLMAALGCGWTTSQEGHPLWANGQVQEPSRPVVVRQYDVFERGKRFVRTVATYVGDYKLIEDILTDVYELYDLAADPMETTNLISQRSDLVAAIREANLYARRRIGWVVNTNKAHHEPALIRNLRIGVASAAFEAFNRIVDAPGDPETMQLIDALGEAGDANGLGVLELLVRRDELPDAVLRRSVQSLALHIGEDTSRWLEMATSTDLAADARAEMIRMYAAGEHDDVVTRLQSVVQDDPSDKVATAAALALCRLAPSAELNALIRTRLPTPEKLEPIDIASVQSLMRCLSREPDDDDIDYLLAVYDTPMARKKKSWYIILEGLGQAKNDRPFDKLSAEMNNRWEPTRIAATHALTKLKTPRATAFVIGLARQNRHFRFDPVLLHAGVKGHARRIDTIPLAQPVPVDWQPAQGATALDTVDAAVEQLLASDTGPALLALHLRRTSVKRTSNRLQLSAGRARASVPVNSLSRSQPLPVYIEVKPGSDNSLTARYTSREKQNATSPLELVSAEVIWL